MSGSENLPGGARLTIVTGADEAYAGCLARLLLSIERRGLLRGCQGVVYDLGLSARRREGLAHRFPWVEMRDFDFDSFPPHVALSACTYAWKPLVVSDAARRAGGPVLWLDSACVVRTDLDEVRAHLEACGMYVLHGQAPLRERMARHLARLLGAEPPLLDHREVVAGVVGVDPRRPAVAALLAQWRAWALDPRSTPPQAPRHNPEQALLSLLVLRARAADTVRLPAVRDVDISAPTPVGWISTREKVPRDWSLSLELLASAWFRAYKAIDQLAHRIRRFKSTRINGLHRWPKGHFQVFVAPVGIPEPAGGEGSLEGLRAVRAPRFSYYADPFVWRRNGETWLFVEEFLYLDHAARLVALPLAPDGRTGPPRPLELVAGPPGVEEGGLPMSAHHWSFPFVFEGDDGELYLVPETCSIGAVDLFVCDAFPHRWRWVRRLLDGADAADTTLVRHDGRWWLFTSVRPHEDAPRALEIHHAEDLIAGAFVPHPVNGERRFADAPFGTGRCGGTWATAPDGAWLRPAQWSARYYGEGLRYMRIDALTPDVFEERPYDGPHPLSALAATVSPHHISAHEGFIAVDARTRVSYGQHVPFWSGALKPSSSLARLRD